MLYIFRPNSVNRPICAQFESSTDRLHKNKEVCLCKQINSFHTKQRSTLPQFLSVHRGREHKLCTQAAVSVEHQICNMQDPFSPHIRDIKTIFRIRSAECTFTQKRSQRELIGRDVSECLVMRIIVGQRQRGWCE